MPRRQDNYILNNRFYVEIESSITACFSECSGFGVDVKKESYLEGGVNNQQRIFLGHSEFQDLTLKRGMTDDLTFWTWVKASTLGGAKQRRNVNILMFNQAGETMQRWTLTGAIPISWRSPGFQAEGNSVAIEEMTLTYEGLDVQTKERGSGRATSGTRDALGFFPSY
jgi:phage tail-like protein